MKYFRRNVACLLLCLIALNLLRAPVAAQQSEPGQSTYDIVIRNGRVLDGAGNRDSSPDFLTWTLDTTGPVVTVDAPPPVSAGNQAAYSVSGELRATTRW